MAAGEAECGETLDVTDSKIAFLATGKCGDSGGPVYLIGSDGTASAVGIDIRGLKPDKADAGCSAPAKFSVAPSSRCATSRRRGAPPPEPPDI
jgi:hypothetical protein